MTEQVCAARGYHLAAGVGFGTSASTTAVGGYCETCGTVLGGFPRTQSVTSSMTWRITTHTGEVVANGAVRVDDGVLTLDGFTPEALAATKSGWLQVDPARPPGHLVIDEAYTWLPGGPEGRMMGELLRPEEEC